MEHDPNFHKFSDAEAALAYTMAGRATITLQSVKTGSHFTFKLAKPRGTKYHPGGRFVSVLVGGVDYRTIGYLDAKRQLRQTKGFVHSDAAAFTAFRFFMDGLAVGRIPAMLLASHSGRCGRCAREITAPNSLFAGWGPECIKHHPAYIAARKAKAPRKSKLKCDVVCQHESVFAPLPGSDDIDDCEMLLCPKCLHVHYKGAWVRCDEEMQDHISCIRSENGHRDDFLAAVNKADPCEITGSGITWWLRPAPTISTLADVATVTVAELVAHVSMSCRSAIQAWAYPA